MFQRRHEFRLLAFLAFCATMPILAAERPNVLLVTAHPDDEAIYSGAVYRITHDLGGIVDLAVMTNGEGGYKYSDLAESIYGLELTREEVGRAYLPGIRKRELLDAGAILKLRNYFFFDQKDTEYTLDLEPVFAAWDLDFIRQRFAQILGQEDYHFVFVMLPTAETHAHHRASAILALEAVKSLPAEQRPVVLGTTILVDAEAPFSYTGFPGHPLTEVAEGAPRFAFDRSRPFGLKDRLNYHIVVNWVIAAHKSQGTMQMLVNRHDIERYVFFALNPASAVEPTSRLFDRLAD